MAGESVGRRRGWTTSRSRRCESEGLGASICRFQVQAHPRPSLRRLVAPLVKAFQPNRQRQQRLVPRLHNLPRTTVNTEDCAGQSIATEASRARGQAAKADSGPGARLRGARQRRLRTYPAKARTVDAAATAAPDTLAKPTHADYRRRLGHILNVPPVSNSPRRPYITHAWIAAPLRSSQIYPTRLAHREWVEFCGASDKRF